MSFFFFVIEKSVRESLVLKIPEIYIRCHELSSTDLDYFLYDRLLDIVLLYLTDNEYDVSYIKNCRI